MGQQWNAANCKYGHIRTLDNLYPGGRCRECAIIRSHYIHLKNRKCDPNRIRYLKHQGPKERFNDAKWHAKDRGHIWELTFDYFAHLIQQPCHYCGNPLSKSKIGLDRSDNSKGYTYSNSVPCCKICNIMKNDLTLDIFYSHIKLIAEKGNRSYQNHSSQYSG